MFEYAIVASESCAEMLKDIRKLLETDWRPQGGVAVGYRDEFISAEEPLVEVRPRTWIRPTAPKRRMYWVQAMVREGETNDDRGN